MLVHAVSTSRLDYCNSLFINMSKSNLFKLQKVQNAAARLVVCKSKRQSVTGVMKELHWLRVESRIIFKILLLMYKRITGQCSENLKIKFKNHNCRPQDYLQLETKRVKLTQTTGNGHLIMWHRGFGTRFHLNCERSKI